MNSSGRKLVLVLFVFIAFNVVAPRGGKTCNKHPNVNITIEGPVMTKQELHCDHMIAENICPNPNISYWLFTRCHVNNPYELVAGNTTSIKKAPFRTPPHTPVQILLHGYDGDMNDSPNTEIKPEYLFSEHDVISVNYPTLVKFPCLQVAIDNGAIIGKCLAKFIKMLLKTGTDKRKFNKHNLHVIGFSLGAQIAAIAGNLLVRTGTTLPRITALDPLLPIISAMHNHVDRKIASFVDVIHTKTIMHDRLKHLGHADFYVNDAIFHGDCESDFDQCNTGMAPTYYADSIINKAPLCFYNYNLTGNRAIMGEHIPFCTRGVFGVITSEFKRKGHGCYNCTSAPKYIRVFKMKDLTITNPSGKSR